MTSLSSIQTCEKIVWVGVCTELPAQNAYGVSIPASLSADNWSANASQVDAGSDSPAFSKSSFQYIS